jgi:predicted DNA binding CopG/RHH family protein
MALKKIPNFKSEDAEREFWSTHDSAEYVDWSKGHVGVFPNLKPSLKTISVRLPESLIEGLKALANKKDVPYQSLMKIYLAERVESEIKGTGTFGKRSNK